MSDTWKTGKTWNNWKSIIKSANAFPIEKHIEELKSLHESRKSRGLFNGKYNSHIIIEAAGTDTNIRARVVEMMILAKRLSYDVRVANESLKNYMFDNRIVDGRSVSDKNRSADNIMAKGLKIEKNLENFIAICRDLVEDIDKAAWTLKLILEGIQIASKPELNL